MRRMIAAMVRLCATRSNCGGCPLYKDGYCLKSYMQKLLIRK